MSNYLEVINNFGSILINDSFKGHVLKTKGIATITSGAGVISLAQVQYAIPSGDPLPLVAIRYQGMFQLFQANLLSGNIFEWTFMLEEAYISTPVEYFIFNEATPNHAPGTGLFVLKNAQDQVIYDSDAKYLNIVDVIFTHYTLSVSNTYPSSNKYAMCITQPMVRITRPDNPGGWLNIRNYGGRIRDDGTSVFFEWLYRNVAPDTGYSLSGNNDYAGFLIVDVTRF